MKALLLDPLGVPTVLDEKEYKDVRTLLEIAHSEPLSLLPLAALTAVLRNYEMSKKNGEAPLPLSAIVYELSDENQIGIDCVGLLVPPLSERKAPWELSKDEMEVVVNLLTVLRAGGWFPAWLSLQVKGIAEGFGPDGNPADRFPSPLQIVATLGEDIAEFEATTRNVRAVVEMRPDLFAPADPKPAPRPKASASSKRGKGTKAA